MAIIENGMDVVACVAAHCDCVYYTAQGVLNKMEAAGIIDEFPDENKETFLISRSTAVGDEHIHCPRCDTDVVFEWREPRPEELIDVIDPTAR